MKKNVFISYSRKDEILISKFRQEERGREFEILIDDEEIVLNEAWQDTIIKKINDSNGAILFISKNALKKDSPIRTLELPLIAKKLKDKKDDFHFFPIFAEDIEQKLLEKYSFTPEGFSKEVNFLDFFQLLPGDRQPLSNLSKRKQRVEFQYINADISELLKGNTLSPGREKIKRERFRRKILYYLLGFILLFLAILVTRQFINTYIDNALDSNPDNIASEDSSTIQFLVEQIDRLENQISILGEDDELSENSTSTTSSTILKNEDDSTSTDNQSTSTTTTTVAPVKTTTTLATTTTVAPNVTTTTTTTLDAEENVADNVRPSRTTSRLTITNVTSNSLTLSWDPFQDNVGIKEYKIFNNDILIGRTTLTNFNVTGLTPGSFHSFEVYGYDLTENTSSNNVSNSIYTLGTTTTSTTTTTTTTVPPTTSTTTTTTTTTTTVPQPEFIYNVHGGSSNDAINAVSTNSSTYYMAGYFSDSITFSDTLSKNNSDASLFISKYEESSGYVWTKNFSSSGSNAAWDIYSKGDFIYITGSFKNSITFGSTTLSSLGGSDIFVAKLSLDGVPLWAKRFGGPHSDVGQSIYVDNSDNVYVGGYFNGENGDTITIGNDTYTTSSATSSSYSDGVLVKLDSSGNFVWSRAFQSIYNTYVEDIITDNSNNVYITGSYRGNVNFGAGNMNYVSGNGFLYIAKYDSSGNYQYAKGYGGNGNEGGRDLAFDSNGNLYLIGYFGSSTGSYSVDFGTGNLSSNGASDILLLKIDNNGNTLQALNFGSSNSDSGHSITIDSENNIYIGGITYGTLNFGNSYTSVGNGDAFIAKLNSSLNPVWIKGVGGSNQDIVLQLADFNSTIIGVGYAQGSSINFSGNYIDSDNSRNGLVFALDTSGNLK